MVFGPDRSSNQIKSNHFLLAGQGHPAEALNYSAVKLFSKYQ